MSIVENNRALIIEDEMAILAAALRGTCRRPVFLDKHNTQKPYVRYDRAIIISDGSGCGILAAAAYKPAVSGAYAKGVYLYDLSKENGGFDVSRLTDNTVVYVFVDTMRHKLSDLILAAIDAVLVAAGKHKAVRFVISMAVPEPKGLPDGVNAVAEREYDYLLETGAVVHGAARDYTLRLQRLCRRAVRDLGHSVSVLRTINVFGPRSTGVFARRFKQIVEDAFSRNKVIVSDADYSEVVSATLISDAVAAAFWAVRNAVFGHEFNVTSYRFSIATLKRRIYASFAGQLSISDTCSAGVPHDWKCLSDLKFLGTRWRKYQSGRMDLSTAIKRTVCYLKGKAFSYGSTVSVYDGKLPQIKAVEMTILREIDRICEKHGIKYFLAGGTLLGAVRNGASIPWDDDFDIGFLRKDFDRFRKACDEELGDTFVHSCHYNGTNSHYMVDKIRMKNTYFSTRYSSIHAVEDGIFIDCLVYDATFDGRLLSKIHDKLCGIFGNLVQAYWREYRRDEVRSRFRWLFVKAMRIFPIGFYHVIYEWLIAFHKADHPSRVIDSMGKHIGLGTIPAGGLTEVKRVPFDEGFMAPIPADPTEYLEYDYGKGYLPLPPYCKRQAPHNFARIDLGRFLFDHTECNTFRNVDLRGELYEEEV